MSSDDLHNNPQKVLDEVAAFIGLPQFKLDLSIDMHECVAVAWRGGVAVAWWRGGMVAVAVGGGGGRWWWR